MTSAFNSFQVHFGATQCGRDCWWECVQELWSWQCTRLHEYWQRCSEIEQGGHSLLRLWYCRPLRTRHESEDYNRSRNCTFYTRLVFFITTCFLSFFHPPVFCLFLCSACCISGYQFCLLHVLRMLIKVVGYDNWLGSYSFCMLVCGVA